jgi:hypothetical protein
VSRAGTRSECLISEDGLLHVGQDVEHVRLVVSEKFTRPIIELHHDKVLAGHQDVKRTCDLVNFNDFWPNMDRDIDIYVKQCDSCSKFKTGRQPTAPLGKLPIVGRQLCTIVEAQRLSRDVRKHTISRPQLRQ